MYSCIHEYFALNAKIKLFRKIFKKFSSLAKMDIVVFFNLSKKKEWVKILVITLYTFHIHTEIFRRKPGSEMYKKQKIVQLAPIHTPMQSQTGAESERCTASTTWLEH